MTDATLTTPVIAQWGAYGVILIALSVVAGMLARALIASYEARLSETKALLQQQPRISVPSPIRFGT